MQSFHLLVIALAGWLNRQQQVVINYLIEENRVLKERLGGQRLQFTNEQRMRLAVKAKLLGRRGLDELETLVICHWQFHYQWIHGQGVVHRPCRRRRSFEQISGNRKAARQPLPPKDSRSAGACA
jgi:hypothetical protein